MKKIILICYALLTSCVMLLAQNTLAVTSPLISDSASEDSLSATETIDTIAHVIIMDAMPHATIHQDSLITLLMKDKRIGFVRGEQVVDGFRVQIYASNRQQLAKKEASELQQRIEGLVDVPVYTVSEPPFWKVRVGNFESRDLANQYKNDFLQLFPELTGSTYVVPDKIIIVR